MDSIKSPPLSSKHIGSVLDDPSSLLNVLQLLDARIRELKREIEFKDVKDDGQTTSHRADSPPHTAPLDAFDDDPDFSDLPRHDHHALRSSYRGVSDTAAPGESEQLDSYDRVGDTLADADKAGAKIHDEEPGLTSPRPSTTGTARYPPHIFVLVGLPARGKSYVSRRITRYWRWRGVPCQTFHYAATRRRLFGPFDRTKESRTEELESTSRAIAAEAVKFANEAGGIAVIDGTNTTSQRRKLLLDMLVEEGMATSRVIFIEIVRDDPGIIQANVARSYEAKVASGALENSPEARARYIDEYNSVIKQYERHATSLCEVHDPDMSFIRIKNHFHVTLHRIEGVIATRLVSLLHNMWFEPHVLYLTRCGEWDDLVEGRLGGNSKLTANGEAFATALANYIDSERKKRNDSTPLLVMSSAQLRARQTCAKLAGLPNVAIRYLPTLDDLNYGDCDGQTLNEVMLTLPNTLRTLLEHPYKNAWPNGESIEQLFESRLEQHILELQATDRDVLVVAHEHIIQGLRLFFDDSLDQNPEEALKIKIPLHHVFKLAPSGSTRKLEVIELMNVQPQH